MLSPKVIRSFAFSTALILCLLTCVVSGPAYGQSATGIIAGNVSDPSGAAVPDASVVAVGKATGLRYPAVSSSAGSYRITGLLPGEYDLFVTRAGFQISRQEGLIVDVSAVTTRNVFLSVGSVTETLTVSAEAPAVESESSDIRTTVSPRQVDELPLPVNGGSLRSPEQFVFLAPGVSGVGSAQGGTNGVFAARISGGQGMGQEVLLDGASVDRSEWHSEFDETAPSVDALQEFTVETSTIPAQYSRTAGGIVTFVTKSGTNEYHGLVYDIFRNQDLDANTWFNNGFIAQNGNTPAARSQFQTPLDRKNDYGATLGGPISIPKLYNGKNRSFFFFSFEQYRQSTSGTSTSTLPTAAQRGGNFSALLGAPTSKTNPCDGTPILTGQIFDPATQKTVGGVPCRTAFPGNQIDPSRFGNVARNVVALLPPTSNGNLTNNYSFSNSYPILQTTYTARVDHALTVKQKLSLSYTYRKNSSQTGLYTLPLPLDPGHQTNSFKTNYARVQHAYTITPSLLNQLTLGYNRYDSAQVEATVGQGIQWANKLGISNVTGFEFPVLNFNDPQRRSTIGSAINNDALDNGYRINDNVSWVIGRHSLDLGANVSYQEYAPNNFANSQGTYNFSTSQTAPTPNFGPTAGDAFASFLLGNVDNSGLTQYAGQPQWRSNYFSLYGQDNLKLTSTLVVSYGLNWSFETPRRELHNRSSSFDPTLINPGVGIPGALAYASGSNRSFISTYYKDFSPRVGFAWSPTSLRGKTAIRGGYGIYYDSLFYGDTGNRTTAGFRATPGFGNGDSFSPAFAIDNGFPQFKKAPFIDPTFQNGQGDVNYVAQGDNRPGYTQNWSLQVQQELAPDLIFSLGYVGTKGNRLRSGFRNTNSTRQSALQFGTVLSEPVTSPNAILAGVSAPFPTFNRLWAGQSNNKVGQALRPFPQYTSLNTRDLLENNGMSTFNALEAQLQRKFRNGLNLLVSYTWSKTLTDSDGLLPFFAQINNGGSVQDPYNRRGEKAVSNEDTPHQVVISYIYELPVGKNRKFVSKAPRLVDAAVGGWQVSAVQRYQSGQPLSFGCAVGIPALDNCTRFNFTGAAVAPRGQLNSSFNPFSPDVNRQTFLNSAAFVDPNLNRGPFIPWKFGNVPRVYSDVRGQRNYNEDFSLQKNTYFTERFYLEFRAEAFNAFNRHIFNSPDANPNDAKLRQSYQRRNRERFS